MAAPAVLLTHPSSVEHDTGENPERAARIIAIEQALRAADWCGYQPVQSPECPLTALTAVHPGRYVTMIRELAESGGGQIDADTVVSPGSWTAARHAAGGAVSLVQRLLAGEASTGISIHRPPGHHAEPGRAMGFCLLNNVAVAARWALDSLGLERVMIVDYDVHHGNGTNAAFHSDPRVLFVSIHQSPLYPGTGPLSDVGSGAGEGFSVNLPVPPGSGDVLFRSMIDSIARPLALAYEPQLILVSAGFDAAAEDPLADCQVTADGFAGMTATLRRVGTELGVPVGAVLEGGYSLQALGPDVIAGMQALAGDRVGDPLAAALVPEVARALAFLARWWPTLG
jgi:acetoin utilization deacetylase AcuC-like enzyme